MSRLLIKLEFFFYFLKSKALKKRIFKIEKKNSLNFKKIISKYRFENFWFLNNIEIINYFLPKSKDIKFDYMEIGSHEGMSLLNILEQYKNVSATAIDLWSDNKIQKVFDENLKDFKNLEKINLDSIIALRKLKDNNREFDYIYVDGLHEGAHVLIDAIQSFRLLKINGIIIFDDFLQYDKNLLYQSYQGIYAFLKLFKKEIKILYFQNILIIKKISKNE
jgi:hypothetical protein